MSQAKNNFFLVTIFDTANFDSIKSRHISTDYRVEEILPLTLV